MTAKSLFRSTSIFAAMTMISRLLGFIRDMVFAQLFGAAGGFDAFVIAFKIPNFMRRLFAEGAFAQAFVPVLSEYHQQRSKKATQQLINRVAGNLASLLLLTVLLGELLAPLIISLFAPGFLQHSDKFNLAVTLLRITMPYLLLIALVAFCASVLNCFGTFGPSAFTPVLLNLALIGAALGLRHWFAIPVVALAWGVFVGGVLQFLFQLPFLARKGLLPKPVIAWRDPGVRRILKLMVPALFGVSVAQISLLVDTLFASFLPTGSISWLYYSDRLVQFPLGVFGVALSTVVLPHLSRQYAAQDTQRFSDGLNWGLRSVLLIAIPACLGLFILAVPLLTTLLHYGHFSSHDVLMAARSLRAFAVGLPAFMLIKVLASGYYSRQRIATPVRIAAIAMVANIGLNVVLIFPLAHAGLALATSLAAWLNTLLLLRGLRKLHISTPHYAWLPYIGQLLVANTIMAGWLFWCLPATNRWLTWGWQMRLAHLFLLLMSAIFIYVLALWLSGLRLRHFRY